MMLFILQQAYLTCTCTHYLSSFPPSSSSLPLPPTSLFLFPPSSSSPTPYPSIFTSMPQPSLPHTLAAPDFRPRRPAPPPVSEEPTHHWNFKSLSPFLPPLTSSLPPSCLSLPPSLPPQPTTYTAYTAPPVPETFPSLTTMM